MWEVPGRLMSDNKNRLSDPFKKRVLRGLYRSALGLHSLISIKHGGNCPRVYYGGARQGNVGGPLVKVKRLRQFFPEEILKYNLVYLLSNTPYLPEFAVKRLNKRNIPIIFNQNGVFYPAWYTGDWQAQNSYMRIPYVHADHVLYQSEFCRRSAERYLGERSGGGEILYNSVDIDHFVPNGKNLKTGPYVFLVTGKFAHHMFYKIESAVRGLRHARNQGCDCVLHIAGWLDDESKIELAHLVNSLELSDVVNTLGPYTQESAPGVYASADAYMLTTHNDACPNAVLEAMACGLPVVHVESGGTPDLVGADAGVAVQTGDDWEQIRVADASQLGNAMMLAIDNHAAMSEAARQRVVDRFSLHHWINRHGDIFQKLLDARP